MEFLLGNWEVLVTVLLALLTTFFGVRFANIKTALRETIEVVDTLVKAIEDDKITKEETKKIVKEAKEAKAAWLKVFKKKN